MIIVVVILLWLLVGSGLGLYQARRGHWHGLWLLGALAGPFALPLTRQIEANEALARPIEMSGATGHGPGSVRLLAGIDGSTESLDAARRAANLLGSRLGDFSLALVTTYEIHDTSVGPLDPDRPEIAAERQILEEAAEELGRWLGFEPSTVLLSGAPAAALQRHAAADRFDLISVGSRGRGLTTRLLGSCASHLAHGAPVATLIVPGQQPVES